MKTLTLFDLETGLFKRVIEVAEKNTNIERHVPEGFGYKEGRFDPLCQCVDLKTGAVIAFDNPERAKREQEARRRAVLATIADLERKSYRPMRELAIDPDNATAKARLAELDAQIVAARAAGEAGTRGCRAATSRTAGTRGSTGVARRVDTACLR